MKSTLITLALVVASVTSFAQGKINIVNDANHAVYFRDPLAPADSALSGTLVTASPTPSGISFVVELWGYAGTAGGSLALLTTASMNASVPGTFGPLGWIAPFPGGSASTFQVRVMGFWNNQLLQYVGQSEVFTMQPGSSIAYNTLVNPGGNTLSTWATGTTVVPGGFGAIGVGYIPEPSSMVLAGLGAASLLFFHRRNPRRSW
jgi:hypothetical protein